MRGAIIGFVAGIGWLQLQAFLPSPSLMITLAASAVILCIFIRYISSVPAKIVMHVIVGSLVGFIWAASFAQFYLADELPRELEGTDITVVGTIDSLPYRFEHGVRFNLAVEEAQDASGSSLELPSKIALSWYSGYDANAGYAIGSVQPGERWQLNVRLRRPHGNANQYGFDYEAWLLEQKLRATGYVRPDAQAARKNARLHSFVPGMKHYVENLRFRLREKILAALPGKEYAGVVVALVVGDQRGIAQSDWEIFNRSGIGHLISKGRLRLQ